MASLILHRAGGSGVGSGDCTGTRAIVMAGSGTVITVDSGDVPAEGTLPRSSVLVGNGGTMPNNGAQSGSLNCGQSKTIPAGYTSGGTVTANSLASQTSATAEAGHVFTGKTAWVSGTKITGTMANKGAVTSSLNCGASYTIPAGYHNGSGTVTANSLSSQTGVDSGKTAVTAGAMLSGYQGWVNGSKISGTIATYNGSVT